VTFIQVHPLLVDSHFFCQFMCNPSQSLIIGFPTIFLPGLHARCFLISLHTIFLFPKVKQSLSLKHFPILSLIICHQIKVFTTSYLDTSKLYSSSLLSLPIMLINPLIYILKITFFLIESFLHFLIPNIHRYIFIFSNSLNFLMLHVY